MNDPEAEFVDTVGQMLQRMDETKALATEIYGALKERGALNRHRIVEYRCRRGCLLLDVLATPAGTIVHHPAYKLSPKLNEQSSNASGRRAHTTDGNRHWQARTTGLEPGFDTDLNCPHVRRFLRWGDLEAAIKTRAGTTIIE